MRRAFLSVLAIVIFVLTVSVTCDSRAATPQSNSSNNSSTTDTQTLQALLREVRELRQDLRTSTIASERAQILLTRLQAQQQAVDSAQKETDAVRNQVNEAELHSKTLENQIKYYSDQDTEEATPDATKRQRIEQMINHWKAELQDAEAQRDAAQSSASQARQQLQLEQSKLDALQSELDQIDRVLANLASAPVN